MDEGEDEAELVSVRPGINDRYFEDDAVETWTDILERRGLQEEEVCFMGDDLLDLPLLSRAGLAAAPKDAVPEVLEIAHWTSSRVGGDGCVRELLETILRARGAWPPATP